jgi:flagellar assembly protein FliH
MMISPSENKGHSLPGMPERLLSGGLGRMNVSRLEFQILDYAGAEAIENIEAGPVPTEAEPLQERISALNGQLELQSQQFVVQLEMARAEAKAELRMEWDAELEEKIDTERGRIARICEKLDKERAQYFADIEAEVVKLALAIASRVLHREVQLDPLLLTGAVRVALEKIADNSTTVLHVPVAEVGRWQESFAKEAKSEIQLTADERLDAGECVLETSVGRVELGVKAQLEEIEKGFFDLLQQRPA